mmetsp:Transcript_5672/g.10132  ORF Transcript_5672/g.10132 Transcript_5672/m.10132 type:complete len:236 (+) Transcript_5672:52-759(+)
METPTPCFVPSGTLSTTRMSKHTLMLHYQPPRYWTALKTCQKSRLVMSSDVTAQEPSQDNIVELFYHPGKSNAIDYALKPEELFKAQMNESEYVLTICLLGSRKDEVANMLLDKYVEYVDALGADLAGFKAQSEDFRINTDDGVKKRVVFYVGDMQRNSIETYARWKLTLTQDTGLVFHVNDSYLGRVALLKSEVENLHDYINTVVENFLKWDMNEFKAEQYQNAAQEELVQSGT